jgi:hypothetical protein
MKLPRRTFLHLAAGAAALPVVPSAPAFGQGTIIPTNATMIVERTQYFAKPGLAADHNGSSGFGGNADSAETTDLRPCKSRLQRCRGVGLNSSFSLPSANLPRPSMAGAFFRSCPGWMR